MATFTLAALASELQNDPTALGYASPLAAGNRAAVAALINAVNVINQVKRVDVMAFEILEAVDTDDFQTSPAPAAGALSWFTSVTQQRVLRLANEDGSDTKILKNLKSLFLPNGNAGANPQTRARLQAASLRSGSRAEKLWGAGVVITDQNIADAGL